MMKRIGKHLSYANVTATLALVLALSGGAIAATGGFSSNGRLQACVNEEGALKLLRAGKRCKRGQKVVSWEQVGPVGAKGANGAIGVPGPSGPAGSPGTPAVTLWAEVNASGQLVAGRGVTNVTGESSKQTITFDRDINNCGISATLSEDPATSVYAERGETSNQIITDSVANGKVAAGAVNLVVTC